VKIEIHCFFLRICICVDLSGEGWFLKRVVVTPPGEEECVFECNRWLDGGEDDGRIERTITLMDEAPPTPLPHGRNTPVSVKERTPSPVQKTPTPPPQAEAKSPSPPPPQPKPEKGEDGFQ
jgi:hypothetical protein